MISIYVTIDINMYDRTTVSLNSDAFYDGVLSYESPAVIFQHLQEINTMEEFIEYAELDVSSFSHDLTGWKYKDISWIDVGHMKLVNGDDINPENTWFGELLKKYYRDIAPYMDDEFDPEEIDLSSECADPGTTYVVGEIDYYDFYAGNACKDVINR